MRPQGRGRGQAGSLLAAFGSGGGGGGNRFRALGWWGRGEHLAFARVFPRDCPCHPHRTARCV